MFDLASICRAKVLSQTQSQMRMYCSIIVYTWYTYVQRESWTRSDEYIRHIHAHTQTNIRYHVSYFIVNICVLLCFAFHFCYDLNYFAGRMVAAILFYFSVRSIQTERHAYILSSIVGGIRKIGFIFSRFSIFLWNRCINNSNVHTNVTETYVFFNELNNIISFVINEHEHIFFQASQPRTKYIIYAFSYHCLHEH